MKTMTRRSTDGVENKIDTFHQSNDLLGNRVTATPKMNLTVDCRFSTIGSLYTELLAIALEMPKWVKYLFLTMTAIAKRSV